MNEEIKKITAWITFLIQALNALVALLSNIPTISTNSPVELVSSGQGKQLAVQTVIAIGFGLLQSWLPRIQKNKSK